MRLMPTMLAAVAAFLVVAPAGAGPGYDAHFVVQHIFDAADRDGSRTLTRAEYGEAGLQRFGVSFDDCDVNSDDEVSLSEYFDLYLRHHPPADPSDA